MENWLLLLQTPINKLDENLQREVYFSFYNMAYIDVYCLIQDHGITEDILQEAFLKITKGAPNLKQQTFIKSWVRQVTRNTAIDWLRKHKKKNKEIASLEVLIEKNQLTLEQVSVASEVERRSRSKALANALSKIKPEYRRLLQMFYWEDKSYKELCVELQITESVLTQRLFRARKKLLHYFLREWADEDAPV